MNYSVRFVHLFRNVTWGKIDAEFMMEIPQDSMISNVNIIPFISDKCVLIRLENAHWEMPGGTREAGEAYLGTLRRELLEEAGANLLSYQTFGSWKCLSSHSEPYKPHLPHPEFFRLVGYGDVVLCSRPVNPEDGEKVVEVKVTSIDEAAEIFIEAERPDLAELYRLAEELRNRSR